VCFIACNILCKELKIPPALQNFAFVQIIVIGMVLYYSRVRRFRLILFSLWSKRSETGSVSLCFRLLKRKQTARFASPTIFSLYFASKWQFSFEIYCVLTFGYTSNIVSQFWNFKIIFFSNQCSNVRNYKNIVSVMRNRKEPHNFGRTGGGAVMWTASGSKLDETHNKNA
jgi:hypothetical protein